MAQKTVLEELFGALKFTKSTKKIIKEIRKERGVDFYSKEFLK